MTTPVALLVSPHLDDVAFSCGGLAALLRDHGWQTILATMFTKSVVPASGFALACQLDKGLGADIDYMALRRAEDTGAAAILGCTALHWLDFPEAPHRGYGSQAELFADIHPEDQIGVLVSDALTTLDQMHRPDLVLAPQGLGSHVDHQIVAACVHAVFGSARVAWYRDTPYAMRQPDAAPLPVARSGERRVVAIAASLERKIAASAAYASQIGFQFGTPAALATLLRAFARAEGHGVASECFQGCELPV